jgi:hypothetical protein
VEAALLERKFRNFKIFEQFLNFCKLCYQYQILELGAPAITTDATNIDQELLFLLFTEILFCSPDFLEQFREIHVDLSIDDLVTTRSKLFPSVNDPKFAEFKNNTDITNDSFVLVLNAIKMLISNICLHTIRAYNSHQIVIQKENQHCDFIITHQALAKAETTTLMTDEEPTIIPRLLQSLITQELQKELQKIQISKLSVPNKKSEVKNIT